MAVHLQIPCCSCIAGQRDVDTGSSSTQPSCVATAPHTSDDLTAHAGLGQQAESRPGPGSLPIHNTSGLQGADGNLVRKYFFPLTPTPFTSADAPPDAYAPPLTWGALPRDEERSRLAAAFREVDFLKSEINAREAAMGCADHALTSLKTQVHPPCMDLGSCLALHLNPLQVEEMEAGLMQGVVVKPLVLDRPVDRSRVLGQALHFGIPGGGELIVRGQRTSHQLPVPAPDDASFGRQGKQARCHSHHPAPVHTGGWSQARRSASATFHHKAGATSRQVPPSRRSPSHILAALEDSLHNSSRPNSARKQRQHVKRQTSHVPFTAQIPDQAPAQPPQLHLHEQASWLTSQLMLQAQRRAVMPHPSPVAPQVQSRIPPAGTAVVSPPLPTMAVANDLALADAKELQETLQQQLDQIKENMQVLQAYSSTATRDQSFTLPLTTPPRHQPPPKKPASKVVRSQRNKRLIKYLVSTAGSPFPLWC